jgi:hypothetical protein
MLDATWIENFRCFRQLSIKGWAPVNVIVGENGAGKTTLLEAMFLAMSGSPQKGLLLRQFRGNDALFQGDPGAIVDAIYAEFFHRLDLGQSPEIKLRGKGQENRTLKIIRGRGNVRIPRDAATTKDAEILSPIIFDWWTGKKRHTAGVKVTPKGFEFENTGEQLPSNWFFYAAQTPVPARENADRFAAVRRAGGAEKFVSTFKSLFDWIDDIFVDSSVGTPVLSAVDRYQRVPLPLTAVSGGINRMAAILLAIALRPKGIVLVDEIENGVFFTKHLPFARALLRFSREYDCQLFLSTHSQEWLRAFAEAAEDRVADIALWRLSRGAKTPEMRRFTGHTFKLGIEQGAEVRREKGDQEDVPSPSDM